MARAWVVGGGPTAVNFYTLLRAAKYVEEKVYATGTMLRPLLAEGIHPDVTMVFDASPALTFQFLNVRCKGLLVYGEGVHWRIPAEWAGPTQPLGRPPDGSSVLIIAVAQAIEDGASEVRLVGADFCYRTGGNGHAHGVALTYPVDINQCQETQDDEGSPVLTDIHLAAYRDQLAGLVAKHPGVRFVRHGAGLPIEGVERAS